MNADIKAVPERGRGFGRFLILWSGELLSSVGTGLTAFGLTAHIFRLSGRASDSALVLLLTFLPSFLIRPLGGVVADRMDRRLLMMIGNIGSAMGILLVMGSLRIGGLELRAAAPGLILCSLFSGFMNPAYKASVSDLLLPELYEKAGGLVQLSGAAALILSPMIAGILMVSADVSVLLLLDVLSFLVSAMIIHFVRMGMVKRDEPEATGTDWEPIREFREGWQVVRSNRGVFTLTIFVACLLFFVSLLQTLLTPLVLSFSTIVSLGTVQTVCACGILAGSLVLGVLGGSLLKLRTLAIVLASMGFFFAFIGLRESLILVIVPGLLFFMTLPLVNTGIEVLIRKNIDKRMQGRAWALISFITYFGSILAFSCAGFLADRIFNPLMANPSGVFSSLELIYGSGKGRGIALLFSLSGGFVILLAILLCRSESVRALEE